MDSANGFKCVICRDPICCDSAKYQSIDLTCGHAFGRSCMRKWIESSNQKECLICKNPLTDNEIKEIKNIPLQEHVAINSDKAIKLFGQTILKLLALPLLYRLLNYHFNKSLALTLRKHMWIVGPAMGLLPWASMASVSTSLPHILCRINFAGDQEWKGLRQRQ